MAEFRSFDPRDGAFRGERPDATGQDLEAALEATRKAFLRWSREPVSTRAEALIRIADVLERRAPELGALMAEEMGKPLSQGIGEARKCAWACRHAAESAPAWLAPEAVPTEAARSYVTHAPMGTVLAVMPWNFPYWQVFRAAAPALMAGNCVALKHASNVPGVALAIESVLREAGAPEGVFVTLLVGAHDVPALVEHEAVAAVTLTGSEAAGVAVAARAGAALKKIVLELGGSDPFVVLADADLPLAVSTAVTARVQNNGQSCIAAKRFIVEAPVAEAFEHAFVERMRALVVGDPMERATQVGPLARPEFVADLESQLERSLGAGAVLATGGRRVNGAPNCFEPTVLTHVTPGMAVFDEETFGPLAPLTRARDAREAVALANRTRFGLGASVWTRDPERGEAFARELRAGAVFVNGMVKSDPRLPFGGIRRSGHGRELAQAGIREFVNLKTVWVG